MQTEQTGQQTGQQMGQQAGMSQSMTRQQQGRLSQQEQSALTSIAQAIEICEWCADQCVQEANPNMVECIRLCEDVSELGESLLALAPRKSRYAENVAQAFQQAIQACAQECGRHRAAHCQECAQTLGQVASAVQPLVQQGGGQQMQMQSW